MAYRSPTPHRRSPGPSRARRGAQAAAVAAVAALAVVAGGAAPSTAASSAPTDQVIVALAAGSDTSSVAACAAGLDVDALTTTTALVSGAASSVARLGSCQAVAGLVPDTSWDAFATDSLTPAHSSATQRATPLPAAPQNQGVKVTGAELPDLAAGVPAGFGLAPGSTGAGATVAVIDTGVADTAVLNRASGRLLDGIDTTVIPLPSTSAEEAAQPPTDDSRDGYGHGTYMASVVAGGEPSPGQAPVGVAPGARVIDVKVGDSAGRTSLARVLVGLAWVAEHADQIDVAVLALAADPPTGKYVADPLTEAVAGIRMAGIPIVVSAGNDRKLGDPAFAPAAITVGAVDYTTQRPNVPAFSGHGKVAGLTKPDVVANGVNVLGALPAGSVLSASDPGRLLWRSTGTSPSAAVAAAVVADVLTRHPNLSVDDVHATLHAAAQPMTRSDQTRDGYGALSVPKTPTRATQQGAPDQLYTGYYGDKFSRAKWLAAWNGHQWTGHQWTGHQWTGHTWTSHDWADHIWTGHQWTGHQWTGHQWTGHQWTGHQWTGHQWTGHTWTGHTWTGQQWAPANANTQP